MATKIAHYKYLKLLTIIALCCGIFRVFSFVSHDPLLAYANNYDMLRMQCWFSICPSNEEISFLTPNWGMRAAPISTYKINPELKCSPYLSSELIFISLGAAYIKLFSIENFSARIFGVIRAAFLVIAAVGISILLWRSQCVQASFTNSLIFAAIISDPVNTLYLNTFYCEFSAMFFLYLSLGLFYYVSVSKKNLYWQLVLIAALCLLGFSKVQHLFLPLGMFLIFVVFQQKNKRSQKILWLLTALILTGILIFQTQGNLGTAKGYRLLNATDTFFGTILPDVDDPHKALTTLGLPEHCYEVIDSYTYELGFSTNHPCPEVEHVSRLKILLLAMQQPQFVVRVTHNALNKFSNGMIQYFGHVEGEQYGKVTNHTFTFTAWIKKIWPTMLNILFVIPGIMILTVFVCIRYSKSDPQRAGLIILASMCAGIYIVFYSSLFGDGYIEIQKHCHLMFMLYYSLATIALSYFISFLITFVLRLVNSQT